MNHITFCRVASRPNTLQRIVVQSDAIYDNTVIWQKVTDISHKAVNVLFVSRPDKRDNSHILRFKTKRCCARLPIEPKHRKILGICHQALFFNVFQIFLVRLENMEKLTVYDHYIINTL